MKTGPNFKLIIFVVSAVIILAAGAFFLFGNGSTAMAQKTANTANSETGSSTPAASSTKTATDFMVDGIFTIEDIAEYSPLGDHTDYLPVETYASYCRQLQSSARYSSNVYTNSFLSMYRYIAAEEVPTYDKFLKDAPTAKDPRPIVMSTIAKNWADYPELIEYGDMVMKIAAQCK